ncbi:RNA polymerase subunit sigma-70 [Ammonicoccus fulvus]|uniref:RNA polymerase subunit sigma-70 n=1 Tax=Ammonicoccus fulvus TaxID=3138240 RepID=A0ABZ3FSC0_9ACTN
MTVADPGSAADPAEFEQATARLRPELIAHCYRMLGSLSDAEDQVQETYLRAWRAYHSFEGRSSVRTWMYRIATNVCINAARAASRRVLPTGLGQPAGDPDAPIEARHDESWLEPLPDAVLWGRAQPEPGEAVAAREGVGLAAVAVLQDLPPNQRATLVLRDVLQFSAGEAAEILGVGVTAVNSALQRARASVGDGLTVEGRPSGSSTRRSARCGPTSVPPSRRTTSMRSWN